MDRRHLIAVLGALAASPVLAQTMPGSTAAGAGGGRVMGTTMGQDEASYIRETMMKGAVALETSRIAMEKARNEEAKRFAKFEVDEQTTIAEVLRSMTEPTATASTGQNPSAMALQGPDAEMVRALQQAQPGREFDREYIEGQLKGHQELLQIQENYIGRGQNREVVNAAKLARGHIREHVAMLQMIQRELR